MQAKLKWLQREVTDLLTEENKLRLKIKSEHKVTLLIHMRCVLLFHYVMCRMVTVLTHQTISSFNFIINSTFNSKLDNVPIASFITL